MQESARQFIKNAQKIHGDRYDYSLVDYVSTKTKVKLLCKIHGPFDQLPSNHLAGSGCKRCGKLISPSEFIKRCQKTHNDSYDYSKCYYIGGEIKVEIICHKHGSFLQRPGDHIHGTGCPSCFGTPKKTTKQFVCEAINVHADRYDYSLVNYKNSKTKVEIVCKIHGIFWQNPRSHLDGTGCSKCAGVKKLSFEEFIERAQQLHNCRYQYDPESYINTGNHLRIVCQEHGEFWQTPAMHIHNNAGCPQCKKRISTMENQWLGSLGLPNDRDHRQVKLTMQDDKKYYVDGFDPVTKTVYEFNGDYWHGNPSKYDSDQLNPTMNKPFGSLYSETMQKYQHLVDNGYQVVSIWESEWKIKRESL